MMFNSRLARAEYLAATGKRAEAIQELLQLPSQADADGRHFISLDARLLLADLRWQTGTLGVRRERAAIRDAARRAGFGLLVARTEEPAMRKPAS